MPESMTDEQTRALDRSYKRLCEFEKPHYEKLEVDEDGSVVIQIDRELYQHLEQGEVINDERFEPVKYSSYNDLFNRRYRNGFKRNLSAVRYNNIENEVGKDNLSKVIQKDQELRKLYSKMTKERDLDNDGVPDRIDVDDTRNSVQTVKDLSTVKNSTSVSTQRYNERKERQRDKDREKQRNNELEL